MSASRWASIRFKSLRVGLLFTAVALPHRNHPCRVDPLRVRDGHNATLQQAQGVVLVLGVVPFLHRSGLSYCSYNRSYSQLLITGRSFYRSLPPYLDGHGCRAGIANRAVHATPTRPLR